MALLTICKYPDEVLRQECSTVTAFNDELHKLLDDMAETMYHENGVGLAAPQVGVTKQITVIDIDRSEDSLLEVINPKIVESSETKIDSEEGCLSIPDYRETIKRSDSITIEAFDRNGKQHTIKGEELLGICLQHEIDHLNGILFIDHMSRMKRDIFKRWYKKNAPL